MMVSLSQKMWLLPPQDSEWKAGGSYFCGKLNFFLFFPELLFIYFPELSLQQQEQIFSVLSVLYFFTPPLYVIIMPVFCVCSVTSYDTKCPPPLSFSHSSLIPILISIGNSLFFHATHFNLQAFFSHRSSILKHIYFTDISLLEGSISCFGIHPRTPLRATICLYTEPRNSMVDVMGNYSN